MSQYYFDGQGRFVIEDYNRQKPFASFLPGIAGIKGIPLWVYYVNRGQGIASFGIENKNGCIMEFLPADKSYQAVSYNGFRTFIKIIDERGTELFEPFSQVASKQGVKERMLIKPNEVAFESVNEEKALSVTVTYFTMPHESFAALCRQVDLKNLSDRPRRLEVIDGMPAVLPFGIDNNAYKEFGHTIRAWMGVFNLENNLPYYKCRASIADSSEVSQVASGHFYLGFSSKGEGSALKPIVDPELVFGSNTAYACPQAFMETPLAALLGRDQVVVNKTPCAFSGIEEDLAPRGEVKLLSLIGHVSDISVVQNDIKRLTTLSFLEKKHLEANQLVRELAGMAETKSASELFDGYVRQCYLDNVLRGGFPLILENGKKNFVYHVYSRKHGDLERDYNFFSLAAEFYSQGNGNFRDANQNRRNDCFFNPRVEDFNVKMFMNLLQTDGYNPLVVKGCTFTLLEDGFEAIARHFEERDRAAVLTFFEKPYTPGRLLKFLQDKHIVPKPGEDELMKLALNYSVQNVEADFGEGYWSDHWTYNMDLIESYLSIYPDRKEKMLFDERDYRYYDSFAFVLPRKDKYVHVNGKIRQYHAHWEDEGKRDLINRRARDKSWVRTRHGKGEVYQTSLFEKLLCLAAIKFTTLDPLGMGIEMEGDKPGWNDSVNGLPGMFGSGIPETLELKRIIRFLLSSEECGNRTIALPEELYTLLFRAARLVEEYNGSQDQNRDFLYWDKTAALRESYREKVFYGLSGELAAVEVRQALSCMRLFLNKINQGIERAKAFGEGLIPTYFTYEAVEWEFIANPDGSRKINQCGMENVRVLKFKPHRVNYFLEGPTRALKVLDDPSEAKDLYSRVRASDLYDEKLRMYKVCASLEGESFEIGRAKAFTPGWLENESVFTHMEYKYILEVLKAGLYEEFFQDMKNVMIPFLDPRVYGRSTLENSSFIASSSNPDPSVHGKGFVARLSGSTAELLSMWIIMTSGKDPFRLENGSLILKLSPILPDWLFTGEGLFTFRFLGTTDVTYFNKNRKNTFGAFGAVIVKTEIEFKDGEHFIIQGDAISGALALRIRNGEAISIKAYLE